MQERAGLMRPRRAMVVAPVLIALVLAGCATAARRQQEAFEEAARIASDCRAKRVSGELKGHVASAQCSNDRIRQVIAASGFPHMDLIDLDLAYRMAVARRIDEGTLSEDDAKLLYAEVRAALSSEVQRRNALAAQTQAHHAQSYRALMEELRQLQPRQPITCHQVMNTITCN